MTTLKQGAEILSAFHFDEKPIWRNDHQDIAYLQMGIQCHGRVQTTRLKTPRFVGMNRLVST